jgi:hypothetical protein
MQEQQAAAGAGPGAGFNPEDFANMQNQGQPEPPKNEGPIDADFEVVDDDKK